jgi:hypothetical protein
MVPDVCFLHTILHTFLAGAQARKRHYRPIIQGFGAHSRRDWITIRSRGRDRAARNWRYQNTVAGHRLGAYLYGMKGQRFTYWQDGQFWLGYLEEFPDYLTQGESLEDLKEHLRDIYRDLTSGAIPAVRHVSELEVA